MSRYRKPQQRSFDDVEVGLSSLSIPVGNFETKFREVCDRLIPDSIFDKLYSSVGREARSPSTLTRLLLLQLRDGASDEKIVNDLFYDLRVRHICDFGFDQRPVHPTNLVYHRLRLLFGTIKRDEIEKLKSSGFSEKDSPLVGVFERIKQAAIELGLVDTESAQLIDSTAILGRGAVMGTYALIFAGIRNALEKYKKSDDEHAQELISRLRRKEYLEDVKKPKIDWDSDSARQELLNDMVCDAMNVIRAGLKFEDAELQSVMMQLAMFVCQDVEISKDFTSGKLTKGVCADRQVSAVDPEMRHGRKSASRKFNGFKGTITADAKSGVITGVHVMGANEHDSVAIVPILENQSDPPPALIGDRAYAAQEPRYEAMKLGVAVVTKPNSASDWFGKSSFDIDSMNGSVTCPNGQVRKIRGKSVSFSGKHCPLDCPYRDECLGTTGTRVIPIRDHEALQRDAEKFAGTDLGKEMLIQRPAIERVIAHWVRNGARQARYFGRLKVWMQCMFSAIMCNVQKIVGKVGDCDAKLLVFDSDVLMFLVAETLEALFAAMFVTLGIRDNLGCQSQQSRFYTFA